MNTRIGFLTYFASTLFILTAKSNGVGGELGLAATYGPPYIPTQCSEDRQGLFPNGNLFAAAGDGLWDNGAACGRRYRVRCISGPNRPCKGGSIEVKIVDYCRKTPCPAAMVLTHEAFSSIARLSAARNINIEYTQL